MTNRSSKSRSGIPRAHKDSELLRPSTIETLTESCSFSISPTSNLFKPSIIGLKNWTTRPISLAFSWCSLATKTISRTREEWRKNKGKTWQQKLEYRIAKHQQKHIRIHRMHLINWSTAFLSGRKNKCLEGSAGEASYYLSPIKTRRTKRRAIAAEI